MKFGKQQDLIPILEVNRQLLTELSERYTQRLAQIAEELLEIDNKLSIYKGFQNDHEK